MTTDIASNSSCVWLTLVVSSLVLLGPLQNLKAQSQNQGPYTKEEIIQAIQVLSQGGAPLDIVIERVSSRGVNFSLSSAVEAELQSAGATPAVLRTIRESYRPPASLAPVPPPPRPPPLSYDKLLSDASTELDSARAAQALALVQRALSMDPRRPQAYELLGFIKLYFERNLAEATSAFQSAIERGGSAGFLVFSAPQGENFHSPVLGILRISSAEVAFEADEKAAGTELNISDITGLGFNAFLGTNLRAFHFAVKPDNAPEKRYNFAPREVVEGVPEFILSLVGNQNTQNR